MLHVDYHSAVHSIVIVGYYFALKPDNDSSIILNFPSFSSQYFSYHKNVNVPFESLGRYDVPWAVDSLSTCYNFHVRFLHLHGQFHYRPMWTLHILLSGLHLGTIMSSVLVVAKPQWFTVAFATGASVPT